MLGKRVKIVRPTDWPEGLSVYVLEFVFNRLVVPLEERVKDPMQACCILQLHPFSKELTDG